MIDPGTTAPDFTLPDQDDAPVTLSSLKGKTVVLYFYPKADAARATRSRRRSPSTLASKTATDASVRGQPRSDHLGSNRRQFSIQPGTPSHALP